MIAIQIDNVVMKFPYQQMKRRYNQNRRLANLLISISVFVAPYLIAWLLVRQDGRWFWNHWVSFHPIMASIVPTGRWGPIENPPRWIQEIHDAPWMGEWEIPTLAKPTYVHDDWTEERKAISPALVKLHVFSTVSVKARLKRHQIRRLSPLLSVPESLRHLVELKFVLGHAYKENWEVDQEMEDLLVEEQRRYGDMIRLNLVHGENLREGKILDWIRAAGTGDDGGRQGWYLFKMDDDVSVVKTLLISRSRDKAEYIDGCGHASISGLVDSARPQDTDVSWYLSESLASISSSLHRDADRILVGIGIFGVMKGWFHVDDIGENNRFGCW